MPFRDGWGCPGQNGLVLGQRILDHRDAIGGFTSIDELRDVSGIGEKTFQSLAPLVSL